MAQSGWRLPDELLRRVRVRCAEEGVRQNAWVEAALEKALLPSPERLQQMADESQAVERLTRPVPKPDPDRRRPIARKPKTAPALGKGLVPPRPKGT